MTNIELEEQGQATPAPDAKGARVRRQSEKRLITDGPFAETKEMVSGWQGRHTPRVEST
jgi:hypothetical protein